MHVEDAVLLAEIEAVYEARVSAFVRTATSIIGDREAGRDAVHDGFVSAVRNRSAFRGGDNLEAWLWRIVIHAALKARRKAKLTAEVHPRDPVANGGSDERSAVRLRIALLPERQRLVLFLRYYADLDYQQIADALGIRRGTVSATLHAAHQSLRQSIEEVPVNE